MADNVNKNLERMVPEFEEMQTTGMFTADEITKIIKKRREHEYSMHRAGKELVDFLRAIEFELNLSYLVKNRSSRLTSKPFLVYPAIIKRIYQLFQSATIKFKGNLRLWLQYLDFASKSKTGEPVGKIFAQAISLHPTFTPFWITAASYEYFNNDNIVAARTLLQRANRINPKAEDVLLEYCRLELCYREKVAKRMDLFGVTESQLSQKVSEDPVVDDLEQLESDGEGQTGDLEKLALGNSHKEVSNPFLKGAIPLAVYQASIKVFPDNFDLRKQFVAMVSSFDHVEHILEKIYESIEEDFAGLPEAQALISVRPYRTYIIEVERKKQDQNSNGAKRNRDHEVDAADHSLSSIVSQVLGNFESAISSRPSSDIYNEYVKWMMDILDKTDESFSLNPGSENPNKEFIDPLVAMTLKRKITLVLKESFNGSFHSESLACNWIDFLLALGKLEEALDIAEKYHQALPSNPTVSIVYLSLLGKVKDLGNDQTSSSSKLKKHLLGDEEFSRLFTEAINQAQIKHPSIGDLFILHWNFLITSQTGKDSTNDMKHAFQLYKKTVASLSGSSLHSFKIKALKSAINRWSGSHIGLVRSVYEIGLDTSPSTIEYYLQCINFELSADQPESEKLCRKLFEMCIKDHGTKHKEPWLAYLEWEESIGNHPAVGTLYTRAKRTLENPDEFVAEYSMIINDLGDKMEVDATDA